MQGEGCGSYRRVSTDVKYVLPQEAQKGYEFAGAIFGPTYTTAVVQISSQAATSLVQSHHL